MEQITELRKLILPHGLNLPMTTFFRHSNKDFIQGWPMYKSSQRGSETKCSKWSISWFKGDPRWSVVFRSPIQKEGFHILLILENRNITKASHERHGIPNQRQRDCSSASGYQQRIYKRLTSLVLFEGNHLWPVDSPHKGPAARKTFPCQDVNSV